jgi:hypothetical protein
MKNLVTLFLFATVFCTNAAKAQAPYFGWAKSAVTAANNTALQEGRAVAVDAQGNVYTTGHFVGTVDFDPGAGTANLTSAGNVDIFIQKLDAAGTYLWAKRIGGTGSDNGYAITLDKGGGVYVTGSFSGTVDFDPGSSTANLTSAGGADIFILKLDRFGNYTWAKKVGGTGYDYGNSIAIDDADNIYTGGNFSGTNVDFNPGSGTANLTSAGDTDAFILKLNASGNYTWAKRVGAASEDRLNAMTVDKDGNVNAAGYFNATVDFDPGSGTVNLTATSGPDIFILKLDAAGNYTWAKRVGSVTSIDFADALAIDGTGNVYITGNFSGTVDFDPGTGTANLTAAGAGVYGDVFVLKLDASGNYKWAKKAGATEDDFGKAIAVDAGGNVYTTGSFNGTVDFDPGSGTANLTSAGSTDVFIQKLDSTGSYSWSAQIGGTSIDNAYGIKADGAGSIYVTGNFRNTADLDPTSGTANHTGNNYGIFIVKMNNCNTSNLANNLDGNIQQTLVGSYLPLVFSNNCNIIAELLPNGASAVSGNVAAKVWIEATQPTNYVKRHYEITPSTNATTATGWVTLYFTQQEFDDFNAVNSVDLPIANYDYSRKANLLIEKRGGTSSDGSGLPGSYTGTISNIDPDDDEIYFNAIQNRWEVSFAATGFSGFFVKTQAALLPLNLTSFSGSRSSDVNKLHWQTETEINTKHFVVERSYDANSFTAISTVAAKGSGANNYNYNDVVKQNGKIFYRLKMVDNDGRFTYSGLVALTEYTEGITVNPNPVKDYAIITINQNLINTKATLTDATGKVMQRITLAHTATSINLSAYPAGMYLLKLQNGQVVKLIKQ